MNSQVWIDPERRDAAINALAMDNAILRNALSTARVNHLDRSVALECALIMLCEENARLFALAVDAESRAVPRNLIAPMPGEMKINGKAKRDHTRKR